MLGGAEVVTTTSGPLSHPFDVEVESSPLWAVSLTGNIRPPQEIKGTTDTE